MWAVHFTGYGLIPGERRLDYACTQGTLCCEKMTVVEDFGSKDKGKHQLFLFEISAPVGYSKVRWVLACTRHLSLSLSLLYSYVSLALASSLSEFAVAF